MLDALTSRIDRSIALALVAGGVVVAAAIATAPVAVPEVHAPPVVVKIVSPPPVPHAPPCDHAVRAKRTFYQPLPAALSYELHHVDDLGHADLDCDRVLDKLDRHVGVDQTELVVQTHPHRERFITFRIALSAPNSTCEARLAFDDAAVEIVLTWMDGARCDRVSRVERYAIREGELYRDGRFLRRGPDR